VGSSTPTVSGAGANSSNPNGGGALTTTIAYPSAVEKIGWNSNSVLGIGLACIVIIQSFMGLI